RWQEYKIYHHNVKEYMKEFNIEDEKDLPDYFVESDSIDWRKRVTVQSALQKGIDHAISSTINLPKDTHFSTVEGIYLSAWKEGLKGVTVYVDGSRSGVLVTGDEKPKQTLLQTLIKHEYVPEDAELTDEKVIVRAVNLPDTFFNG